MYNFRTYFCLFFNTEQGVARSTDKSTFIICIIIYNNIKTQYVLIKYSRYLSGSSSTVNNAFEINNLKKILVVAIYYDYIFFCAHFYNNGLNAITVQVVVFSCTSRQSLTSPKIVLRFVDYVFATIEIPADRVGNNNIQIEVVVIVVSNRKKDEERRICNDGKATYTAVADLRRDTIRPKVGALSSSSRTRSCSRVTTTPTAACRRTLTIKICFLQRKTDNNLCFIVCLLVQTH